MEAGWIAHLALLYSMLALGDLFRHARRVGGAAARGDTAGARAAIGMLVGRDTTRMDSDACRRAAIESLAESFVDGFLSAVFWYVVAGLPGLLAFKVASTMDSMVGYKTPQYLRFGWFGARFDDVMNYVPARLAWLLIAAVALVIPRTSAHKGLRVGWEQHGVIPGPNPGWSEATMAGALERRLIGPIWRNGALVTELWVGDPGDPAAGSENDLNLALRLATAAATLTVVIAVALISFWTQFVT
jgi:adenosylcobinamide-phosphate synthase